MTLSPFRTGRGIGLLLAVSFISHPGLAQDYTSPFPSGSSAPNMNATPGYGYGGGMGSPYSQPSPYGQYRGEAQYNAGPSGNYGSYTPYNAQQQPQGSMQAISPLGGAPIATPAPMAGAPNTSASGADSKTGATPSASPGSSPTAAARGSLRDGDILHGRATAMSGSTITVEGVTISLHGLMSPSVDSVCSASAGMTWKCGQKAKDILSGILTSGPVKCIFSSMGGIPSGQCSIGFDDVSRLAVQEGAAMSNDLEYRWYSNEARSDRRGVWAYAGG